MGTRSSPGSRGGPARTPAPTRWAHPHLRGRRDHRGAGCEGLDTVPNPVRVVQAHETQGAVAALAVGGSSNVSLRSSTVSGNSTTGSSSDGGGIAAIGSGYVTLTNSTVSGNTTTGTAAEGGGIFVRGDFNATNSTIANNGTTNLTSEGGGAVAFPVMTLALGIKPAIARDFSLMIQSCGQ